MSRTQSKHLPIGLGIIANVLRNEGYEVKILDINAEQLSKSQVTERISLDSKYEVIGVGGLITTYRYLKWLIPEIRKRNPDSKIVIGGGVVTSQPTLLLERTPADVAVIGEGEKTMKELMVAFEKDTSLSKVDGIAYKQGNRIKVTRARKPIENLDSLPFPAYDLFPLHIYLNIVVHAHIIGKKKELTLLTSRDCPFNCNFCFHLTGRGTRARSSDNIIEEIKLVKSYGVESIAFCDDTFTFNRKRVMEFCEKMVSERIGVSWDCYSRVDTVDKELLSAMKKAGCFRVGYGIESGSQKILDNMNKQVTVDQAKNAIRLTRNAGMYCGMTFMFGYPGETTETIRETIKFCRELSIPASFFYATPFPSTKLYEQVKHKILEKYGTEENFIEALGDAKNFTVNLTDFPDQKLINLKRETESRLRLNRFHPKYMNVMHKQFGFLNLIRFTASKYMRQKRKNG